MWSDRPAPPAPEPTRRPDAALSSGSGFRPLLAVLLAVPVLVMAVGVLLPDLARHGPPVVIPREEEFRLLDVWTEHPAGAGRLRVRLEFSDFLDPDTIDRVSVHGLQGGVPVLTREFGGSTSVLVLVVEGDLPIRAAVRIGDGSGPLRSYLGEELEGWTPISAPE